MDALWIEFTKALTLCAKASGAPTNPHWTAYMTALFTPVVAFLGVLIAYRQWVTARDKLRLDLFERRLAIYSAFRTTLGQIFVKGQLNQEDEQKYLNGVSSSMWLFGEDVHKYLADEFWGKLMEHHLLVSELDGAVVGIERRELAKKKSELRSWFLVQDKRAEMLFLPYLGFHHLTAHRKPQKR